MRLEHINMFVSDLKTSLHFYQAAFPHWSIRSKGQGEWYGKARNWLHFGDDYQYLAMSDPGEGVNRDLTSNQIGLSHLAFEVKNLSAIIERLADAGYSPSSSGSEHPFRKNIYFQDPDNFEIEFVEYLTDIPSERNSD